MLQRSKSATTTIASSGFLWLIPQNSPAQVIPIGDLKTRIQETLKYGDCTDYIKKLIAKVAEQNPGNPASPADIMGLYDQINGQTNGGGFVGTRRDYVWNNGST